MEYLGALSSQTQGAQVLRDAAKGARAGQNAAETFDLVCSCGYSREPGSDRQDACEIEAELQRFLQFHDQQTAGVPGLNLLYEGMQARVTEKLVKNKNVVILKHSPCTVLGWELHPADAASAPGAERMLTYTPRCIYLKFAGAKWTVDKRLGAGGWPLFPVHHTWELNAAQGSKIERYGFTLLSRLCQHRIYDSGRYSASSYCRLR